MTSDEYTIKLIEGIDRLEKKLGERIIATIDDSRIEKLEKKISELKEIVHLHMKRETIDKIDRMEKKIMKISEVMASFLYAEILLEERIGKLEDGK